MRGQEITIGKLSDHTGVKVETIRYYEKIGLMPSPPRKSGGHRLYGPQFVDRLCFIRRGRELGFSLSDIRKLFGLEDGQPTCEQVHALTQEHIKDIRRKIADLKKLERTLSETAKQCLKDSTPDCAVIHALSSLPARD